MPDVSIIHDRCALLIIRTIIRQIRIDLNVRHRHMEVIHVHPAALIKPDLHKQIRVVLAAPGDIRRICIEMTPDLWQ
jgi:hypothetical protein